MCRFGAKIRSAQSARDDTHCCSLVCLVQLYQCSLELYGLCRLAQNQGNTLASTDWERLVQNEDKLRHLMVSILPPAPSGTRGSENRRRKRKREETKEADSRKSKLPTLHSNAAAFAKRCSDCQTEVTRQWRKGPGGQSTYVHLVVGGKTGRSPACPTLTLVVWLQSMQCLRHALLKAPEKAPRSRSQQNCLPSAEPGRP